MLFAQVAAMGLDPTQAMLGLGFLVQFGAVAFWGGMMSARVRSLEARMSGMEAQLRELNGSISWMRKPANFGDRAQD